MISKLSRCCIGVLLLIVVSSARGAAPDGRYMSVTGGVKDLVTGLLWQVPTNGMTYQWSSAKAVCTSPWHLATIQELLTLYDYSTTSGIDPAFVGGGYWSSTISGNSAALAWLVAFGSGPNIKNTTITLQALCVQ